jgi:hypothetical protein
MKIRLISDLRKEIKPSPFEALFKLEGKNCENMFEIVNRTNKIFNDACNILKSIK